MRAVALSRPPLSRGRTSNHLYTTLDPTAERYETACNVPDHPAAPAAGPAGPTAVARGLEDPALLEDLSRALTRDLRQQLASPRLADGDALLAGYAHSGQRSPRGGLNWHRGLSGLDHSRQHDTREHDTGLSL